MRKHRCFGSVILLMVVVSAGLSGAQDQKPGSEPQVVPINRKKLCITKGAIEQLQGSQLEVTVPEMRAVADYQTESVAEAKFTYLGRSKKDKPLASGEIRRQFGLKLRAQNGCNLVYAMWTVAPKSELKVLLKKNPGMTTHAQCGANGYHAIKPERDLPPPSLREGEEHKLRAEISDGTLRVWIDGKLHFEGLVHDALDFNGPSGIRSDNGRFKFEFLSSPPVNHGETLPCHADGGGED